MDQKILPLALNQSVFSECIQHLEKILSTYKTLINKNYQGYINHCIRMAGCYLMQTNYIKEIVAKPCFILLSKVCVD